jgi:hypothetical protein
VARPGQHRAAADLLARWAASAAPHHPDGASITAALAAAEDAGLTGQLGERVVMYAEDGVRAVFRLLGLSDAVLRA